MKPNSTALAVSLLSSVLLLNAQAASAQANPAACHRHTAGQDTAGAKLHAQQSPPATTTQTTGEASRDPTVKKMNEDEKAKVETKGK